MGKIWDILPPRPRPKTKPQTKTKKRSSNRGTFFFGVVVLIFLGVFFFETAKNSPQNINGLATANPAASKTSSPEPTSTKKETNKLLIKLLNGSGRSEETAVIKELLSDQGFPVSKTENALNIYDQTIVYFEPQKEKEAREIVKILTKYRPKLQQFSQDSPYDMIIVIGAR